MRFIDEFQIRSVNGHTQCAPIDEIQTLVEFILRHGLSEIAKVSFYITDDEEPGAFRNVILRNHAGLFIPEYCDEVYLQEDWALVKNVLNYGNLDEMLLRYVQAPAAP